MRHFIMIIYVFCLYYIITRKVILVYVVILVNHLIHEVFLQETCSHIANQLIHDVVLQKLDL